MRQHRTEPRPITCSRQETDRDQQPTAEAPGAAAPRRADLLRLILDIRRLAHDPSLAPDDAMRRIPSSGSKLRS
jgi:hypothetical protein